MLPVLADHLRDMHGIDVSNVRRLNKQVVVHEGSSLELISSGIAAALGMSERNLSDAAYRPRESQPHVLSFAEG